MNEDYDDFEDLEGVEKLGVRINDELKPLILVI